MNNLLSKITPLLEWVKANPLLMFCGVIILLSGASFYWPTHVYHAAFLVETEARDQESRKIQGYFNSAADLPPIEPDDPPRRINMVIKEAATNKLKDVYKYLGLQHDGIFQLAVEANKSGHSLLVEDVFPEPVGDDADMLPYKARTNYTNAFLQLYQEGLHAGTPPSGDEIKALMEKEEADLRSTLFLNATAALSDAQKIDLTHRQSVRLLDLYKTTAAKYHVYADAPALKATPWKTGPFQIADWARQAKKPLQAELWAGQMEFWIQQDLCQAITLANKGASLIDDPVKQLLSIKVSPLYIGYVPLPPASAGALLPTFPEDAAIRETLNKRLPDNFTASPTGRITNYLYDVRRASMSVIVESRKIPDFINALGKVNFTTVVGMAIKDIDEFDSLRRGYWYGPCDVVQLDLELESIWLRPWTAGNFSKDDAKFRIEKNPAEKENPGYMPDAVRVSLGLKPWEQERYLEFLKKQLPGVR